MLRKLLFFILLALAVTSYAEDAVVKVEYDGKIEIHNLHNDVRYVLDRKYIFKDVPRNLLFNKITILKGNARKPITVKVPANTFVYLCLDSGKNMKRSEETEVKEYVKVLRRQGWRSSGRIKTSDSRMKYLQVFRKQFYQAATEKLIGVGFPGTMIIAKSIELEKKKK